LPDQPPLRVVQISPGRFHHLDLANQLARHDVLSRFYVGYPKFQLAKHGFSQAGTVSFPWFVLPFFALTRAGIRSRPLRRWLECASHWSIDLFAAATLPECDALIALSQSGLRAGKRVRRRGGIYICDRGSSHIRYQNEILHEEFRRWGDEFPGVDRWVIAREEAEYDAADIITVPSSFALRSFVESGVPAAKLRRIPYGADVSKFAPAGQPPDGRFDILFAGQAGFRKGVPDLLEAFRRLQHPAKRLRIAGGVQPELQRFLRRSPPPENVEFLGHVPPHELKRLMNTSHVMVLPSIEEGLALVMAQAMACACPVIASVNTGAEDLFTDGGQGFIIPIRAPEAITARLQQLADEPALRDAMAQAALARVQTLGGWNAYGDEILRVLRQAYSPTAPAGLAMTHA
jgi:glycosyltransferase involved in cell wall biosynthesis